LFEEAKRKTRAVAVFPNEVSAATLATEISSGSSEQWTLKRYLTMDALEAVSRSNPQPSRHRPAKYRLLMETLDRSSAKL
jgi:putative transposase